MAVLALGVVGSALGSAIGIGASAGWLGGVLLGNLLFGGGKGQNIEGPRIDDLSVQTSTYGAPIPLVYGTMRISGNVIWSTPLKETRTVKKSSGGKGGGKKSSQTSWGSGLLQMQQTGSKPCCDAAPPCTSLARFWRAINACRPNCETVCSVLKLCRRA